MTNRDRIAELKNMRNNYKKIDGADYCDDTHEHYREIESLNWAIKICEKFESKRLADKHNFGY